MKYLQIFGVTIITLIVTAFVTTPSFFNYMSVTTLMVVATLIVGLLFMIVATVGQLSRYFYPLPNNVQVWVALLLFFMSSMLFVFFPEYFKAGVSLPMSFWHRVSFYTLPAIAFETGVITLFRLLVLGSVKVSRYEKKYLQTGVIVYAICVMVINFMTILGVMPVYTHLAISQGVIVTMIIFATLVALKNKARSR
jgi:hypothetical protein